MNSLLRQGLVEEVPAGLQDEVWRTADGARLTLKATSAAHTALGIGASEGASQTNGHVSAAAGGAPSTQARAMPSTRKRAPRATQAAKGAARAQKGRVGRSAATKASVRKPKAKPEDGRAGTKQAALIEMLQTKEGASVTDIMEATGWQAHTVRGAIAGALKKKLGLKIVSEKVEARGRVYRISD